LGSNTEGQRLNINADTSGAALAVSLMVRKFVTLSAEGGVLDKTGSIIPVLNIRSGAIDSLIADGTIDEDMIPKIEGIVASVKELSDDASAVITLPSALIRELFTHAGEGTLIRKGEDIDHYTSVRAVNHTMIRQLIESSFNGKLLRDYFTNLPESAEVFTTPQVYNGVAIVIPNSGQNSEQLPAYLDKLVVRPGFQGYGIGDELLDAVISHYKGGLYWRTRADNHENIVDWYRKIADSSMDANGWTVFTVGVPAAQQNECLQKAINVEASISYQT
jgi:acetylglutamate kinase